MPELDSALQKVGLPAVVKAQVLAGGRGKAGGVAVVKTRDEARRRRPGYWSSGSAARDRAPSFWRGPPPP